MSPADAVGKCDGKDGSHAVVPKQTQGDGHKAAPPTLTVPPLPFPGTVPLDALCGAGAGELLAGPAVVGVRLGGLAVDDIVVIWIPVAVPAKVLVPVLPLMHAAMSHPTLQLPGVELWHGPPVVGEGGWAEAVAPLVGVPGWEGEVAVPGVDVGVGAPLEELVAVGGGWDDAAADAAHLRLQATNVPRSDTHSNEPQRFFRQPGQGSSEMLLTPVRVSPLKQGNTCLVPIERELIASGTECPSKAYRATLRWSEAFPHRETALMPADMFARLAPWFALKTWWAVASACVASASSR